MHQASNPREALWPKPLSSEPELGSAEVEASSSTSDDEPRIQVVCRGVPAHAEQRENLRQWVRSLLLPHNEELSLVVIRLERTPDHRLRGLYGCRVEVFNRGLEHVAGYGEDVEISQAVAQATSRSLRALDARTRFDPWTSPSPSSHPVPPSVRPPSTRRGSTRPPSTRPSASTRPPSMRPAASTRPPSTRPAAPARPPSTRPPPR